MARKHTKFSRLKNEEFINIAQAAVDQLNDLLKSDDDKSDVLEVVKELFERVINGTGHMTQ